MKWSVFPYRTKVDVQNKQHALPYRTKRVVIRPQTLPDIRKTTPTGNNLRPAKYATENIQCLALEHHVGLWCRWFRINSTCLATRYEVHGPGIESKWGRNFQHPSRPALGHGVNHPPPSSSEVKERVELYFYSSLGIQACFKANCTLP